MPVKYTVADAAESTRGRVSRGCLSVFVCKREQAESKAALPGNKLVIETEATGAEMVRVMLSLPLASDPWKLQQNHRKA